MLSGFRRHPTQIFQHNLIENALSDIMGCAGFTILFVGTTGEVVVVGGHRMRPVEYHCFATIGTNYQSGILVLLIHLRPAALVLPHPLHNIPDLFGNDGRMRIFKHEAFFPWVFNFALVLIGPGAEPVVHGIAEIDLIFQQVRDRAVRPMIRLCNVQGGMCQTVFLVSVIAGAIDFFFRQDRRDPAGAIARGTQVKIRFTTAAASSSMSSFLVSRSLT